MTDTPKADLTWLPHMAIESDDNYDREMAPDEDHEPAEDAT